MFYIWKDICVIAEEKKTILMNSWLNMINVNLGENIVTFVLVYHSRNSSHSEFLRLLEEYLDDLVSSNRVEVLIVLGDFNLDWNSNVLHDSTSLDNTIQEN